MAAVSVLKIRCPNLTGINPFLLCQLHLFFGKAPFWPDHHINLFGKMSLQDIFEILTLLLPEKDL